MKKILIGGLAVVAIIAVTAFFITRDKEEVVGATPSAGAEIDYASDVIGSRTGTTTIGAYFATETASTTYRVRTGGASQAVFTVLVTHASTTAHASFNFYGSNDWDCATASSTGGNLNPILTSDINWYDIGTHLNNLAGSATLSTATSTISWTPTAGASNDIVLTNLNYECIKVDASALASILLMQVRLK